MLRRPDPTKKKLPVAFPSGGSGGGDSSNSRFLHEIEALSKALALDPKARRLSLPPDPKPRPEPKPKPTSIWRWKPLKALSHLRHPCRFDCTFSLLVHSIEGLPPALASSAFVVHWRRPSDSSGARTRPAKAFHGSAEFEEALTCRCSVYGSRGGGPHGAAKYEPRHFLVYVTLAGATGFDFGKQRVELTRILPVMMEELEDEKSSGEWSTSFRLGGKARGATLNVSFGYSVGTEGGGGDRKGEGLRRVGSVRGVSFSGQERPRIVAKPPVEIMKQEAEVDLKPDYEVFDELTESPELKCCMSAEPGRVSEENECEEPEYTVIEKGVEIDSRGGISEFRSEKAELERVNQGDEVVCQEPIEETLLPIDAVPQDLDLEKEMEGLESPMIEFEKMRLNDFGSANLNLPIIELEGLESPRIEFEQIRSNYKARGMKSKSLSLDDVTETVASEFLSMLGLENSSGSDTESPREQLWKQFQKESWNADDGIFGPDTICSDISEDFDLSSVIHAAEVEQEKECVAVNGKSRAKMLEDAETEALMREWGLDDKAFETYQPGSMSGFGSPIHLPPEEPLKLLPLDQ